MRSIEPIFKKIEPGGERYIPQARVFLGQVRARMESLGLLQAQDSFSYGGYEIKVSIQPDGKEIVWISHEKKAGEGEEKCRKYVSGLRFGWSPGFLDKEDGRAPAPIEWSQDYGIAPYSASEFTGEMAKVAQLLMGMRAFKDKFSPAQDGFHAKWDKTHGIFRDWLVEIGKDGIFAKKFKKCKGRLSGEQEKVKEVLGYYPDFGGEIQGEKLGEIQEFYLKNPFSIRWGWAFSKDGAKAVNTCWEFFEDDTSHGYKFYEYIVEFWEEKGELKFSLSLNDSGWARYVWNGTDPADSVLLVPRLDGSLAKFDFALSDNVKTVLGADGEEAPIFSFFLDDGKLDGLKHINSNITTQNIYDDPNSTECLPEGITERNYGVTKESGAEQGVYPKNTLNPLQRDRRTGQTYYYYLLKVGVPNKSGTKLYEPDCLYQIQTEAFVWKGGNGEQGKSCGIVPQGTRNGYFVYQYIEVDKQYDHYLGSVNNRHRGYRRVGPGNTNTQIQAYRMSNDYWCTNVGGYCDGKVQSDALYWELVWEPETGSCYNPQNLERYVGTITQVDRWEPRTITIKCPDSPDYTQVDGVCGDELRESSLPPLTTPTHYPDPEWKYDVLDRHREDSLKFYYNGQKRNVFSRQSYYDPVNGWDGVIDAPGWGNEYIFRYESAKRMIAAGDMWTGQLLYSSEMNGVSGDKLKSELNSFYDIVSLPATVVYSWIGVPGDVESIQ